MAVQAYLASHPGAELLDELTEIESGKKKNRPELAEAVKLCKRHNEPPRFYRRLLSSYFKLQCRLFSSFDSMRPPLLWV